MTATADARIVERAEANLVAQCLALFGSPPGRADAGDDVALACSTVGDPQLNGVFRSRLRGDVEAAIDGVLERFRGLRGGVLWWVGPGSEPADLAVRLRARGGAPAGTLVGMAIDLTAGVPRVEGPPGLEVVRVTGLRELDRFTGPFASAFEMSPGTANALRDAFARLGFDHPYRHVLGCLRGRPVATASWFDAAGTAGLFNVGVPSNRRHRGLGAAITAAALADVAACGHAEAVLASTPSGLGVYERLGFRDLGARWELVVVPAPR